MDTRWIHKIVFPIPYLIFILLNLLFLLVIVFFEMLNSFVSFSADFCESKMKDVPIEQLKRQSAILQYKAKEKLKI
jgi:hypothetical protein